jgi:hypothetical protein
VLDVNFNVFNSTYIIRGIPRNPITSATNMTYKYFRIRGYLGKFCKKLEKMVQYLCASLIAAHQCVPKHARHLKKNLSCFDKEN